MQQRLSVIDGPDGPCVVKHAPPGPGVEHLRSEHAALTMLAHPGVVALVDWTDDERGASLVTRYVGTTSVADLDDLDLETAVVLGAQLAATLGDVHRAGRTHGAIQADHVLLDEAGRPVLCSFGRGRRADAATTLVDVSAMGAMLQSMLDRATGHGRTRRDNRVHSAVRSIADAAARGALSADEVGSRLASLHDPDATARHHSSPAAPAAAARQSTNQNDRGGTRTWRERVPPLPDDRLGSRRVFTAAAVAAMAVAATGAAWAGHYLGSRPGRLAPVAALVDAVDRAPTETETAAPSEATASATARPIPSVAPTAAAAPSAHAAAPTPTSAPTSRPTPMCPAGLGGPDVDGDGCPDDVEIRGNLVRAGTAWFRVGDTGDVVAVDDWNCSGQATPALVRRTTGEVFVFTVWPDSAEPLDALPLGVVAGAVALRPASPAGCGELIVTGPRGDVTVRLEVAP